MENWDFQTRQLELPPHFSRSHLVSTIKGDMDARPDVDPSGAGTFGESAGTHLRLIDRALQHVRITVPRIGEPGEVTIQNTIQNANTDAEKGPWVDDVAEVLRRVSERITGQLKLADFAFAWHPCELPGPYPGACPELTWQLMTQTNSTGDQAVAYVLNVSNLSYFSVKNVSMDMGLLQRPGELRRGQKLLEPGESCTACFLEHASGQRAALAVHLLGYRQMGRQPTRHQVRKAVEMCNLATRKRHIMSYNTFREGYRLNQNSFIPVLTPAWSEYNPDPRIRGRFASSAIVKLNADAEEFCPAMLNEMFVLVVDAICDHIARDGPPQLDAFLALWPEAGVRIVANTVSMPVDAEMADPSARAKAELTAAKKTIELIKDAEKNGRPVWAEAMVQHGCHQAQECAPTLEEVKTTFNALFPILPAENRTPVFLDAVRAVIGQLDQPPTFDYSIEEGGMRSCQIRTPECLGKLMLLVYGMRCLGSHGSAEKTLQGALSNKGLTDFTFADVGDLAVAQHLNAMLAEMRQKKHKFSPTMAAVSNVHRIYGRFAQIITEAVGHVVVTNFPDIKCFGTGVSHVAGDVGAFGLYRYRAPAPPNDAAAADSEDKEGAGYDVFADDD